MDYTDILYEVKNGTAYITINRPEKYNAFRGEICEELIYAFNRAGWDKSVGAIVLSGAGDKAFCTCLLYTSPSPRDGLLSRMPSSA